ncbi:MAG TPA: YIP1 family protein [Blastocatellia bacterium]|nr:YIP1 family protein [Blastocatellia bacterium]
MLESILLLVGVTYLIRHLKDRKLNAAAYSGVDPEKFAVWHKAHLTTTFTVLLGTWGVFLVKLGTRVAFWRADLSPNVGLAIVGACLAVWAAVFVFADIRRRKAKHLADEARIGGQAWIGPANRVTSTLLSPSATFEDINRRATWLAPFIVAILTTWAFAEVYEWRIKPDHAQILLNQSKKNAERTGTPVPAEQEEMIRKSAPYVAKGYVVIFALGMPVGFLIMSGIFALGMLLMQAQSSFLRILSVVSWSFASTGVVAAVVVAASVLTQDPGPFKTVPWYLANTYSATNLAAALPADASAVVRALASSVDVFSIWRLILLTIGLTAVAGSRRTKKASVAMLVWGFWGFLVLVSVLAAAAGFSPT